MQEHILSLTKKEQELLFSSTQLAITHLATEKSDECKEAMLMYEAIMHKLSYNLNIIQKIESGSANNTTGVF